MDPNVTDCEQPNQSADADLRRTAPAWHDDDLMKLIWDLQTDGAPVEAAFPEAAVDSPLDATNPQFIDEDEMAAAWLNCQVIEAQGGATQDQPPVLEGSDLAPLAAAADGKRAMVSGSEREESEVLMLGQTSQRSAPYSSVSAERKRKKASQNRRDRINSKIKVLQELIPTCKKPDKASTLDEAIEYMKFLQLQLQMMSGGCNASPLLFPGIRPFMPPMGLGMHMGLGMDLGMNTGVEMSHGCPMLPFGPPPFPYPAIAGHPQAQLGPTPPSLLFQAAAPTINQVSDEPINLLNLLHYPGRSPDGVQIPPISEPYPWFLGPRSSLVPPQNQVLYEAQTDAGDSSARSHSSRLKR
ncbi:uncharacterized protein LOC141825177 [Curcuma longa]|uniref:uncharacterized protein LOC141825177 n=1 Tax=Curcuma longa TaxID=136217 RepID=UPI003D9DEDC9